MQPTKSPLAAAATNRQELQRQLDAGFCWVPLGTTQIDRPLVVRSGATLRGYGMKSVLQLVGGGPWAVVVRQETGYIYGACLESFAVQDAGVKWEMFAQHCGMDRVWASNAPGAGFEFDGDGERLRVRDCVAWGNRGDGFAVRCGTTNNGIVFDHCNAQDNLGDGFVLETTAENAELTMCVLNDCTSQENIGAQIRLAGYVTSTRIHDTWLESPALDSKGIVAEPRVSTNPNRPEGWRVVGTEITGNTKVSQIRDAVVLLDAPATNIDSLVVTPEPGDSAFVQWRQFAPTGRMNRLNQSFLSQLPTTIPTIQGGTHGTATVSPV